MLKCVAGVITEGINQYLNCQSIVTLTTMCKESMSAGKPAQVKCFLMQKLEVKVSSHMLTDPTSEVNTQEAC